MRCDVPEVPEQTVTRFLGGMNREIADMVELQPYWSFEDICKLAIKVEKQLKGKRFSSRTSTKVTSYFKDASSSKIESTSTKYKGEEKSAKPSKEFRKKLEGDTRKCFKCHGYGHFQANCPNRRVMTLQEIEEINSALQEAESNPDQNGFESEKEEEVVEKADDGEMLIIRRALHTEFLLIMSKGRTSFTPVALLTGRYVQ
ncbi:unnamed protein product [Musa textilis]